MNEEFHNESYKNLINQLDKFSMPVTTLPRVLVSEQALSPPNKFIYYTLYQHLYKEDLMPEHYKIDYIIKDRSGLDRLELFLDNNSFAIKLAILPWLQENVPLVTLINSERCLHPFLFIEYKLRCINTSANLSVDIVYNSLKFHLLNPIRENLLKGSCTIVGKSEDDYTMVNVRIDRKTP